MHSLRFRSCPGKQIHMVGLDVTRKIVLTPNLVDYLCVWEPKSAEKFGTSTRFYMDFHWEQEGIIGCVINDPLAAAYLIDPTLCSGFSACTAVETEGLCLGQTVVDAFDFWKAPVNSYILTETAPLRFMEMFFERITNMPASVLSPMLQQLMGPDAAVKEGKSMKRSAEMKTPGKTMSRSLVLCIIAFSAVQKLLGGNVALLLRLPVYLDSFGTMFTAVLLGPAAGMVPGIISGVIGGCTSDVYAFFYPSGTDDTGTGMRPHCPADTLSEGKNPVEAPPSRSGDQSARHNRQLPDHCPGIRGNHFLRFHCYWYSCFILQEFR